MKKFFFLLTTIGIHSAFAVNPIPTVSGGAQSGNYYTNGTYGSTMTINGNTTYYTNGQYQGQAPANSTIFQNRSQQSIINSTPPATNNQQQLMNSTPQDTLNPP
jgi:hypothetical protein